MRATCLAALLACFVAGGCDDDTTATSTDLAVGDLAVGDLGASDLAASVALDLANTCNYAPDAFPSSVDAGGFCDGTPIAGTCVQAVFARIASCFAPAGCCAARAGINVFINWESGASFADQSHDPIGWGMNGHNCGGGTTRYFAEDGGAHYLEAFYADNGLSFSRDVNSKIVFCSDGTTFPLNSIQGQCPALDALFNQRPVVPSCTATCCTPYGP